MLVKHCLYHLKCLHAQSPRLNRIHLHLLRAHKFCEPCKPVPKRSGEGFIFWRIVFEPKAEDVKRVRFAIQFRVKACNEIVAI